jgi:hypothetical protein
VGFADGNYYKDERLQWSLSSQEGHESYARMACVVALSRLGGR